MSTEVEAVGRGAWRHGVTAAVGGFVGLGWWLWFRLPEELCAPAEYGCGFLAVVLMPLLPPLSALVAWLVLRRLDVDRPGVTAVVGLGVALLILCVALVIDTKQAYTGPELPASVSLAAVGAVSFLVGGLLTTRRVYRE